MLTRMTPIPLPDDAAGLGLRRPLLPAMRRAAAGSFDFLETAPENWIGVGGALGERVAYIHVAGHYDEAEIGRAHV